VRPAGAGDLAALLELAAELREALLPTAEAGLRPGSPAGRAALEQRLREALDSQDRQLVLVVDDRDEPLGMALFTVASANALLDVPALHMTHAVVGDRHRRRGAGRALVAAAAAAAEERGLDQVVVSVRAGSREANRFFARLGFAPLAVRRAATVGVVRRRLAQDELGPVGARLRARRPLVPPIPAQPAPVGTAAAPEPDA
jgi:ribosomal protein S18 acetylase RimI-like enzyme